MATNISLGTYVQDGVRSGPFYTGQLPANFVADANGVLTSSSHENYGPGVLFSPQNTWNITPYTASLVNLVAQTAAAAIPGAMDLTLFGDGAATTYINTNGNPYIQFDWPRVPTVTITSAVAGGLRVTIFGTDWYGMPLQHTYVVDAEQNYPVVTLGAAASIVPAAKAFYTVNRVYISGALGGGSVISLGVSDVFGLPYVVNNAGDITSIGWDLFSDLTIFTAFGNPVKPLGCFVAGDFTNPSTAITGDVRGLYSPSSASNSARKLRFTSYVSGADVWQNQLANRQQIQAMNGQPVISVPVAPLRPSNLYGMTQFYTGSPS